MMSQSSDLTLCYPFVGKILENNSGVWDSCLCECSGYIDEDYSAVITNHCKKHKTLNRIPWDQEFESQCLNSDIALV